MTWEEVLAIDENGIIINYEVRFEPLEFTETLTTSSVNTTILMVVIRSLQEYVEYNISVRAYTSVGPGPYSDPVTERTFEDGNVPVHYLSFNTILTQAIVQSSVPAEPPQNVQATAISSTEISVTWDEIPGLDQNGVIIDYEVQIEALDFPADILLNTTDLLLVVTGLEEYVNYSISVRAYTSVGPGPYSDPVTERTLEDGNYT